MRGLWRLRFTQSDNEPPRDEDVRSGDVPCRGVLRASYLRPMRLCVCPPATHKPRRVAYALISTSLSANPFLHARFPIESFF